MNPETFTPEEIQHFNNFAKIQADEKKEFYSSNLSRKACDIFALYSSIAVPESVDWQRLETETGLQAVERYLKNHPEDKEMFYRFQQPKADAAAAGNSGLNLNLVGVLDPSKQEKQAQAQVQPFA